MAQSQEDLKQIRLSLAKLRPPPVVQHQMLGTLRQNAQRVYVLQKICEQQATITTIAGETFVVTMVGNPLEATANDLCALVNQASGCAACARAVLFLEEEWMLGASLIGDYVMDCNDCIREQFRGIFFDTDE